MRDGLSRIPIAGAIITAIVAFFIDAPSENGAIEYALLVGLIFGVGAFIVLSLIVWVFRGMKK